jgi:predicted ester cyclase
MPGYEMNNKFAQLRDFAERHTAAWCSQDAARVAEFFSPNGSLQVNHAAPAVGRPAITAVAQSFMTAFPDLLIAMDDLVIQGERVQYHWTLSGANTGPGGSGKRVRISGYEEGEFSADGLVARSLGHFDAAEYQRQLEHGLNAPPK